MAPVIFGSGDGSQRLLEVLAENGMGMQQQASPQTAAVPTGETMVVWTLHVDPFTHVEMRRSRRLDSSRHTLSYRLSHTPL